MSIKGVILTKDADVRELATRIGKDIGGVDKLTTGDKKSVVAAINEVKKATVEAGEIYATKEEAAKLASKVELQQAITDLINGADEDDDTLKELADKIADLFEADENFAQQVNAIDSDKASRTELNQVETELSSSIQEAKTQLQTAISAEETSRKAEDKAIRGEFAKADQDLKKAVDAADAAIRSEFAAADKSLKNTFEAADTAIRGELTQADQALKQEIKQELEARKAEDGAIRGELAESSQQAQKALEDEAAERLAEDTAIRNDFTLADQELQKAIDSEAATRKAQDTDIRNKYATKAELTQAITDLINGADADSDSLKELADKITALAQADKGLVSATETQSFKAANKEIARNNIDAVAKATFEKEVAEIDKVKATREELSLAKTELRDSINTKSTQLRSSIEDEVANRKADSAAIRTAFAHADDMNKEALTAMINTKEISLRSEVTNYIEVLQSGIDAESVVRKVEDTAIRSELAQADKKLKDGLIETINARDSSIRNDFNKADSLVQAAVLAEEGARKAEDEAIRGELSLIDQSLKAKVASEENARKAEDTAIRGELAGINQLIQSTIDAESAARKAEDAAIRSEFATKNELTQAITDLINGADADSDTLKELADKITALAQADKGLVSATSAQTFQEANKEIARNNIDAVSKAAFDESVATINSTKADRTELAQAKTELNQSIQDKGVELKAAIDAEEAERKSENNAIRSELALADQSLKDDIEAKDAAIRSELAQTDQKLQEAISAEEQARNAENAVIRSDFTQADQELKEAVDADSKAIRGELTKAGEQIQAAIEAEKTAREASETAINEQITAKADKAPEGEEYALISAIPDLAPYATKDELTQAITDLINGADADSDTLKELADKITALAQADKGLVSAANKQSFKAAEKETARKNIDAASTAELNTAVETLNNTHAKRSELEQAKTELSDSIKANASQLLEAISAEEAARKVEEQAIRGELTKTDEKIQGAIDAIPEVDLTSYATKVELTQAITDLINGADADSDTLKELADKITALAQADKGLVNVTVAQEFTAEQKEQGRSNLDAVSTADLEAQKEGLLGGIATAIEPLATKAELKAKADKAPEGEEYALVSSLTELVAPLATKAELTQAITDLINGADADSDTLKELADKITALAQADNGLVNATQAQSFTVEQQKQARTNIAALAEEDLEFGEGYAERFAEALEQAISDGITEGQA